MRIINTVLDLENALIDTLLPQISEMMASGVAKQIMYGEGGRDAYNQAVKILQNKKLQSSKIQDFCEVVFQLRDYFTLFKNFTEFLLASKNYEAVCIFVNRTLNSHLGQIQYISRAKSYRIEERYFDRFVEVIKNGNLSPDLYLPFFVEIFKSDNDSILSFYKEPLKEYYLNVIKNNDEDMQKLFYFNDSIDLLEYFLQTNTKKTIAFVLNNYISGKNFDDATMQKFALKYKREFLDEIQQEIEKFDDKQIIKLLPLLNLFKDEKQVDDRLVNIYSGVKNEKIKVYFEKELGLDKFKKAESFEDFKNHVNKSTKVIQERIYGLRLKKYFDEHNILPKSFEAKLMTFTMETFKSLEDNNIKYMPQYFGYIDKDLQNSFAKIVFDMSVVKNKLFKSKWALRLICCFAGKELFEVFIKYFAENCPKSNSIITTVGQYLSDLKREEFVILLSDVLKMDFPVKFKNFFNRQLEKFANENAVDKDEIDDKLTDDFGVNANGEIIFDLGRRVLKIIINNDLSINYFNAKTNKPARISGDVEFNDIKIKNHIAKLKKQLIFQTKRFINKFYNVKMYSQEAFVEYILKNNLLYTIAKNLVWGTYKNGKLVDVFKLKDKQPDMIVGAHEHVGEYMIGLVHPTELQEKLAFVKEKAGKLAFDQLNIDVFDINKYSENAQWVDSFAGVFANAKSFVNKMKHKGYRFNNVNSSGFYQELVKPNEKLDLLSQVEFDNIKQGEEERFSTTISKIRFYRLSSVLIEEGVYVLNKTEALSLSLISPRVFSDELMHIYMSCSNK